MLLKGSCVTCLSRSDHCQSVLQYPLFSLFLIPLRILVLMVFCVEPLTLTTCTVAKNEIWNQFMLENMEHFSFSLGVHSMSVFFTIDFNIRFVILFSVWQIKFHSNALHFLSCSWWTFWAILFPDSCDQCSCNPVCTSLSVGGH